MPTVWILRLRISSRRAVSVVTAKRFYVTSLADTRWWWWILDDFVFLIGIVSLRYLDDFLHDDWKTGGGRRIDNWLIGWFFSLDLELECLVFCRMIGGQERWSSLFGLGNPLVRMLSVWGIWDRCDCAYDYVFFLVLVFRIDIGVRVLCLRQALCST